MVVLLLAGLVGLAGCSRGGGRGGGEAYAPDIDPARFTTRIDNPFLPLAVGSRWVYEGRGEEGTERIVVEVTDRTRRVMGVQTVVVHDVSTVDGVVAEDTYDWYAQDDEGNVWYFGEDTTSIEDGRRSTRGSWEAGVDGARPGIAMKARPAVGDRYRQEYRVGEAEDMAEVLRLDATVTVPFGSFDSVLVTRDSTPLEPDVVEQKYYARGIGAVRTEQVKGGDEQVDLVEWTAPPPAPDDETTPAEAGFAPAVLRARAEVPGLNESSGLAASRVAPGLLWTHNDSGDDPRLYCLDVEGRGCGVWEVAGADAEDWEDMAAGPGPEPGRSYLYLGDIGDNDAERASVTVYRVPEPTPTRGQTSSAPRPTAPAEAIRLRYADGPHDAEALLVHPSTGALYVITKSPGEGGVYVARDGVLHRVATLDVGFGTWVTGGAISPDGRRVAVSTPLGGIELTLPSGAGGFDSIWAQRPVPVDLGPRAQGESVTYRLDGAALLATSERAPMPLWEAVRR